MVHDSLVICCMVTCPNQGIWGVELSKYFTTEEGREGSFFLHRFAISVLKGVNGEVEAL